MCGHFAEAIQGLVGRLWARHFSIPGVGREATKPVFAPFLQTLVITLSIPKLSLKNSFCSQISGDCNQTFNHTLEHTNQTFVLSPGKASTLARGAHRSTQTHNLTFAPKPEESNISNSHWTCSIILEGFGVFTQGVWHGQARPYMFHV